MNLSVKRELEAVANGLSRVLGRVIYDCARLDLRQLACRHLLKLYLALVVRSKTLPIPLMVSQVLLRTIRSLFHLRALETMSSSDANDKLEGEILSKNNYLNANEVIVQNLELNLDLLSILWNRIPMDIKREREELNQNNNNDTNNNSITTMDGDTYSYDDEVFTSGVDGVQPNGLLILLQAAVFSGGVLRNYSSQENHRRRLSALGTIESISDGLEMIVFETTQYSTVAEEKSISKSASILHHIPMLSSSKLKSNAILFHLSNLLVQLVGVLRNFALDASGRSKMLSSEILPSICCLLRPFRDYPELRLNCVRVTAKLSLQEPFRTQINANPRHVIFLVEIILQESAACQRVMDGDEDSYAGDDYAWPYWYTWPMLSRTAFTLGNLTTTNDFNRYAIQCTVFEYRDMLNT